MINSPSSSQRITVHGQGAQSETMMLSQFRDAVGYSKQMPQPARELKQAGIVKLAGSTMAVKASGVLDGNQLRELVATDGLEGAAVAGAGIPDGTVVTSITVPATPAQRGSVVLSNVAPFVPATGLAQDVVFTLIVPRSVICGLPATDGLGGARVSGSGIPDGTTVQEVTVAAVAPTNTQPGIPGEVALTLPPPPPPPPTPPSTGPAVAAAPAPRKAAVLTPVDLTFAIPTAPIVFPDGVSMLQLTPAEPIKALTVTLAPNPVDGQVAYIYSTLAIAELTILANVNQKLNWSPAPPKVKTAPADKPPFLALPADTSVGYLYSLGNATWDRIA